MLLLLHPISQLFFLFLFLFFIFVSENGNFFVIVVGIIVESPISNAILLSNITLIAKADAVIFSFTNFSTVHFC